MVPCFQQKRCICPFCRKGGGDGLGVCTSRCCREQQQDKTQNPHPDVYTWGTGREKNGVMRWQNMTKFLLYNTHRRENKLKKQKKWTTETEQRHFRISNHVLFRNDRGPQSSWENMKSQHTGLFYWEVKVLVTTPPSKKHIKIYNYFLNTLQICCWSLCLNQILFSNAYRKLCYLRLLLRPILSISLTLNQHTTVIKLFYFFLNHIPEFISAGLA